MTFDLWDLEGMEYFLHNHSLYFCWSRSIQVCVSWSMSKFIMCVRNLTVKAPHLHFLEKKNRAINLKSGI